MERRGSERSVEDSVDTHTSVSPAAVVDVAIAEFSRRGYADARLDSIARDSGMSKRMIHYHFGDKRGLYVQSVIRAIQLMHPPEDELQFDSGVPVEGVRKLLDALYQQFISHPDAIRLLVLENVINETTPEEFVPFRDGSSMTFHLDRLLLLGQDSGAFRPGISSFDVYTLMTSIIFNREIGHTLTRKLFGVDLHDEQNTEGLHHLLVDTVLAFLTSNIPSSGQSSYLTRQATSEDSAEPADDLYSEGSSLSGGLFIDE